MDMSIIRPLLVADMKQRLIIERRIGSDYILPQTEDMIEQIGKCKTMSDINQLLCNYHMLFLDETECLGIEVVSVDGTQEYVIGLLTERISGGYPRGYPSRAGEKITMNYE